MTTNEPSRLDRIEQIVAENAIAIAQHRATTDQWFDRMQQNLDRTQQQIDSNTAAIAANSAAIAQGQQETASLKAFLEEEVTTLVSFITTLGESFDEQFKRIERQFEEDRAERLALSADVRSLVEALRARFGGNGHIDTPHA